MKQVTLEQITEMVKSGEEFKIRVNPETSKLVQEAIFAGGGRWVCSAEPTVIQENKPVLIYFKVGHTKGLYLYQQHIIELDGTYHVQEVKLIDSTSFKTQQEILSYLTVPGNKVIGAGIDTIWYFKQGLLWKQSLKNKDKVEQEYSINFVDVENYKKYIEPKWYEGIPEQGILCWVADSLVNLTNKSIATRVKGKQGKGFVSVSGCYWGYAEPLTEEEVKQYIYKQEK